MELRELRRRNKLLEKENEVLGHLLVTLSSQILFAAPLLVVMPVIIKRLRFVSTYRTNEKLASLDASLR